MQYYIVIIGGKANSDNNGNVFLYTEDNAPLSATSSIIPVYIHSTNGDVYMVHYQDSNILFPAVIK